MPVNCRLTQSITIVLGLLVANLDFAIAGDDAFRAATAAVAIAPDESPRDGRLRALQKAIRENGPRFTRQALVLEGAAKLAAKARTYTETIALMFGYACQNTLSEIQKLGGEYAGYVPSRRVQEGGGYQGDATMISTDLRSPSAFSIEVIRVETATSPRTLRHPFAQTDILGAGTFQTG